MKTDMFDVRINSRRLAQAAVLALGLAVAPLAQAQLLEYDGFDYTGTALNGQNGGTGWTFAWADPDADAPLSNDGVSLDFPVTVTHSTVGSRLAFTGVGEAVRVFGTPMTLNANTNYYFSALVKRQGPFRVEFRDTPQTNVRWSFGATNASDAFLGVTAATVAPGIFPANETVFIIVKMAATTGNDQVFMKVYRAGQTVPVSEPASWDAASVATASGVILTNMTITNSSAVALEIDEIRIGRHWTNVAGPPPAAAPVVTLHPSPANSYPGDTVQFTADFNGALPLALQWYHDTTPVLNGTNATLTISNVQALDAGTYYLTLTNSFGGTNSNPATLTVTPFTNTTVGLVGLWHFDETTGLTAADATTNNNTGTLTNFVGDNTQWVTGVSNGALAFNSAQSNAVQVAHSSSIGLNLARRFSVATWIKSAVPLSANGNTYRMLEKENQFFLLQGDGNTNGVGVGGMNVLIKRAGANVSASIGQALLANRWYHVAATYDGSALNIYLDGELKQSRSFTNVLSTDTSTQPLRIGSDYSTTASQIKYFNGVMDEVGIWERPLTISEIGQLVGPLTIVEQPQSVTNYLGSSAVFSVGARGQGPLQYQWLKGTNEIRGATSNVLTLVNIQFADADDYSCRITNPQGDVVSDPAALAVLPITDILNANEAFWHFDETSGLVAADASGKGRNGDLQHYVGDDTQWVPGQITNALAFDGQSNRVVCSTAANLNLSHDATFAFWIRPTNYGTISFGDNFSRNTSRILRKGTHFDIELVDDPGSVRATLRANTIPAPQNSVQLNEWQHFVVVFTGGTVSFYKNGFRLADPAPANLGAANTNVVVLGNITDAFTATNLFAGNMDEVGIWGRVLTDTEILNLAGRDISGAPAIVAQPQSATRYVGGSVSFSVDATGKRPVTYYWDHDGTLIPNSDTNRLVITNLTSLDAGNYTVTVSNEVGLATSAPPAVLTILQVSNVGSGLIAYWTFDETNGATLADASGHGHHAALQNAVAVAGNIGVVGGSFNFDGINDFAIVPHAAELNLADQASISVWISPRRLMVAGDRSRIVRKDINFDFTTLSIGARVMMYGNNKAEYLAPANSLNTNLWQHFAVVVKDGTIQFFKNGRSLAPAMPGTLGPENLRDLIIGNFGNDMSVPRLFDGFMDELGIWNRALTVEEVDGIYQNGLVGLPLNAPFVPFEIVSLTLTNGSQTRLIYSTPYSDREHAIQYKADFSQTTWSNVTAGSLSNLGSGVFDALFDTPAGPTAFYRIAALAQGPIFYDDFETGGPGWTHGLISFANDPWQVGVPVNPSGPSSAFSGTNTYGTGLTSGINAMTEAYLRSPSINLTTATRATLKFQHWRLLDTFGVDYQATSINVLDAGTLAVIQQILPPTYTATSGWELQTLPLPPQVLGRNVIIEFRLLSDGYCPGDCYPGWFLDDVTVLPE